MNFKTSFVTERLILRKPTIEDANAIFKIMHKIKM